MKLQRGICPSCGRSVALRKGKLVREHRRDAKLAKHLGLDPDKICTGSGKRASYVVPS